MTDAKQDRLATLAEQYAFSEQAVRHLYEAVAAGGGDMALFDHPELRGPGQWMRGGLLMTTTPGDRVFNNRIEALCNALSALLRQSEAEPPAGHRRVSAGARAWDTQASARRSWWPDAWGPPAATGWQDDIAYAYFDTADRLAIRRGDDILLYDTAGHRITGIAQSQTNTIAGLVFTTPHGELALDALERIATDTAAGEDDSPAASGTAADATPDRRGDSADILDAIEKLGALHRQGVLTDSEFTTKKQELLKRL